MITETKLDDTFLEAHFHIKGFKTPVRFDRKSYLGVTLSYFRININAILLRGYLFSNDIEAFFIEITVNSCSGQYVPRIVLIELMSSVT